MSTTERIDELNRVYSPEEYLATEAFAQAKHEFLGGSIYAMAGANRTHNRIASNLAGMLYLRLRGGPCQIFGSDMKLKWSASELRFYYPDAMVTCDPTDDAAQFCERPSVIFEIISDETRGIDEREKRLAYLGIASLKAYVRIEQAAPVIVVDSRDGDRWVTWRYSGLQTTFEIASPALNLPLAEIYEGVTFPA